MQRLLYGVDRYLRDGRDVLAGFRTDGPYGRIVVDDEAYEIAHLGKYGWHFRLLDERDQTVCDYTPSRLVRGGRLRGRWTDVSLRATPLRPFRWVFRGDGGWRLQAKVSAALPREQEVVEVGGAHVRRVTLSGGPAYEIELDGEPPVRSTELSLQLAFGCWILVERQSLPVPSTGGG